MLALPEGYRPLAVDLRGFGGTYGADNTLSDTPLYDFGYQGSVGAVPGGLRGAPAQA